jgi:hypothetical protein
MGARLDKLENVMHRSIFYRFIGKLKSLQLKLFNDIKIMDPFSDFFGIQNDIVNKINFTSSNYNIKIELLKYVNNKEYKIIEFPIFSKIDEVFI